LASDKQSVVIAALIANAAIAALKVVGYTITRSPSMLSEAYHSFSDVGNQVLLLVGLKFSRRKATQEHPYGWGKAEFFYSFVVAMMLFGIAGWESLREGYQHLMHAGEAEEVAEIFGQTTLLGWEFPAIWVNYVILAMAAAFEFYAFTKARAGMRESMRRGRYKNLAETFRETKEAAILTAFTEDFIALIGLGIAFFALMLTQITRNPIFDALGALIIGAMLMTFAVVLAWEQKRLLIGEAMEPWQEDEIRSIFLGGDAVEGCGNLRTVYFGAHKILLTADLVFAADVPASRIDKTVGELEAKVRERFPYIWRAYLETDSVTPVSE
jgi:cation diffusion facilitator family transporter